jgi:hypothetical protein
MQAGSGSLKNKGSLRAALMELCRGVAFVASISSRAEGGRMSPACCRDRLRENSLLPKYIVTAPESPAIPRTAVPLPAPFHAVHNCEYSALPVAVQVHLSRLVAPHVELAGKAAG